MTIDQQAVETEEELRRDVVALRRALVEAREIIQRQQAQIKELRHAADARLAASELRFREFMDHSPAIAFIKDESGRKVYVNGQYQKFFGEPRDLLGKTDFDTHPPEVAQRLQEIDRQVLASGEFRETIEEVPTPDGMRRKWLVYKFRLQDAQGNQQLGGVGVDITAQLRTQAELARARDELEQRVEQRTANLSQANEQLQQEIARRERSEADLRRDRQFLRRLLDLQERERYSNAREIHDRLLQEVVGAHFLLQAYLHAFQDGGSADERPSADPLVSANPRDLENSLYFLSRAMNEGRRLISEMHPLIIEEQGIVAAIEYLVAEHNATSAIALTFDCCVSFQRLLSMAEDNLFRIVHEALTNVRRHSQARTARIELTEAAGWVILTISDDGIGFDPLAVETQHFGLRGIEQRAQLFGGSTVIDSQPGRGTRIRVELPLQPQDGPPLED